MDEAELKAKNDDLLRRQAERAAMKGEVKSAGSVIGGRAAIDTLVDRIREIPQEEPAELEGVIAHAADNEEALRIKRSGIPDRYIAETFDTYRPRSSEESKNLAAVKAFAESSDASPGVLVMLGGVGTGKTHLGCACINVRAGQYIDIPTLEIEVECSRDFSAPENKLAVLNKYARTPFLVIDEIGRASSPAAEKAILYYVLNKRYSANRPTVLITNFNEKEFAQLLGAALIDRIAEKRVKIEFTGTSYRRRVQEAQAS